MVERHPSCRPPQQAKRRTAVASQALTTEEPRGRAGIPSRLRERPSASCRKNTPICIQALLVGHWVRQSAQVDKSCYTTVSCGAADSNLLQPDAGVHRRVEASADSNHRRDGVLPHFLAATPPPPVRRVPQNSDHRSIIYGPSTLPARELYDLND
jgi:hypothetical protein